MEVLTSRHILREIEMVHCSTFVDCFYANMASDAGERKKAARHEADGMAILERLAKELPRALERERYDFVRNLANAVHATEPRRGKVAPLGELLTDLGQYMSVLQSRLWNGNAVKVPKHYARACAFLGTYMEDAMPRLGSPDRDFARVLANDSKEVAAMLDPGEASGT